MNVYLVQHGEALSKEENPERPLSEKGKADIRKTASFVSEHLDFSVTSIYHSTKTRAQQTAEILGEHFNPLGGVSSVDGLDPLADPFLWVTRLNSSEEDTMVVGHLPHLSKLAALLLCRDDTKIIVKFQMGGILCLEKGDGGFWSVAWMVVPQLIG